MLITIRVLMGNYGLNLGTTIIDTLSNKIKQISEAANIVGVIIVGHGEFATGINSVIELVAGKQESIELVDFLQGIQAIHSGKI